MSYTKGPWNIHPHYYPIDGEETVCADFRALTISIAKGEQLLGEASAYIPNEGYSTGYPRVNDYEEAKANARLIAAAPELAEALKDALMIIEVGVETGTFELAGSLAEIPAKATLALKKAGLA